MALTDNEAIASLNHGDHGVERWGLGLCTRISIPACTAWRGARRTRRTRRKALDALCGLRTSVFFVIREAMGCFSMRVRLTTPSHVARCARELSGAARHTRNRWWRLARPCARHCVELRGFADVLRVLGSRPTATLRADCVFIARVGLLRRGVAASVCIADARASPASTSLPRHGSQAPTRPSEYAICSSPPRSRRKTPDASG